MDNSFGKRLQSLRKELKMGQKEFALLMGVKHAVTVSRWENDKQRPELNILTKLVNIDEVNLGWLMTGNGEMFNKETPYPATGERPYEESTPKALYYDNMRSFADVPGGNDGYYLTDPSLTADISLPAAVKISGDSMEPTLKNADIVLIDISEECKTPEADGIYALKIGKTAVIRRYAGKVSEGARFSADNGMYPEYILEPEESAAKIIGRVAAVILRKL